MDCNHSAMYLLNFFNNSECGNLLIKKLMNSREVMNCFFGGNASAIILETDDFTVEFDIVPFPEAGFVGFYAFRAGLKPGKLKSNLHKVHSHEEKGAICKI